MLNSNGDYIKTTFNVKATIALIKSADFDYDSIEDMKDGTVDITFLEDCSEFEDWAEENEVEYTLI